MNFRWEYDQENISWSELEKMYLAVPLGSKSAEDLKLVFTNSLYKCFVYHDDKLIAAGRALADGMDCSYLADIGVLPYYQGLGLGRAIVKKLVEFSAGYRKIILYANPGKETFYAKLGFDKLQTGMAIFKHRDKMLANGTISEFKNQ